MILKLGFRNLLRNKRRSFLSALAIGIGLSCLIIADGFMIGMKESIVKTVTASYMGEAQVHASGYRDNPEVENIIAHLDEVTTKLSNTQGVKAWTDRVLSIGMLTSPANVINVQLVGINTEREPQVSRLKKVVVEGSFIKKDRDLLIGKRLSKKLDVQVGEKIVVTVAQSGSDELSQELFRVVGLINFGSKGLDDGSAFVSSKKLRSMLSVGEIAHELVLKFDNPKVAQKPQDQIWQELKFNNAETSPWVDLVPGVMAALKMGENSTSILATLLFVIVLLGILNTLFMSIYERMYEFGVLQAVGTRPTHIFLIILSEAWWLGLLSIFLGILFTLGIGVLININGIDYSGIEMSEVTFTEPIYAIFTLQQFTVFPLLLLLFTLTAAIYPAIHAARITIAEAMKKSL